MIPAKHTRRAQFFFRFYVSLMLRSHFRDFKIEEFPFIDPERPIVVLANHFSWWDGFTHYYLNYFYIRKRFHVMMLEEELEKRRFLRNIGAFSVQRGHRSILNSLQYAIDRLQNPENLLLLFPTGRLQTLYSEHFPFQKGVLRILDKAPADLQVVFSFILPEFGSFPKPALHAYLQNYELQQANLHEIEQAFQAMYYRVTAKQFQRVW